MNCWRIIYFAGKLKHFFKHIRQIENAQELLINQKNYISSI